MTDKKAAPASRADLAKQIDQIDLARTQAVLDIFARPEMVKAKAELEAIFDEAEVTPALGTGASATSVNALVRTALSPFNNVPEVGVRLLASIEQRLNPPQPVDPEQVEADMARRRAALAPES